MTTATTIQPDRSAHALLGGTAAAFFSLFTIVLSTSAAVSVMM